MGESSLSIPKARIEKFKSYVKPATKKQLRSIIGLCSYYRNFVPAFVNLSSCLNCALTNTSDKVVWNTTMIDAFNKIIFNICDHTLLQYPPMMINSLYLVIPLLMELVLCISSAW